MNHYFFHPVPQNGVLSALPYICLFLCSILFSWIARVLESKKILPTVVSRKVFNTVGMFGPAAALVWVSFVGCDIQLTMVAMCLALGLSAGIYSGYLVRINQWHL